MGAIDEVKLRLANGQTATILSTRELDQRVSALEAALANQAGPYKAGDTIDGAQVNTAGYVTAKGHRIAGQIPLSRAVPSNLTFQVDWEKTAMKAWQNYPTLDGQVITGEVLDPTRATIVGANGKAECIARYGEGANHGSGYVFLDRIGLKYEGGMWEQAAGTLSFFTANDFGIAFSVESPGNGKDGQTYTHPDTGETLTYARLSEFVINNAPCGISMVIYGTFVDKDV